uniref:T9SS type A sorting domain-containing protein n=1 Tax=Mariniflexile sp. TaxID=1979402 RepID=UPI004047F4E0
MKKITFLLFVTLFAFAFAHAQVFDQNYEGLTIGDPASSAGNQMEGGSGTVQIATATGNSTQILKAIHTSGVADMYVRSGNFAVSEGQIYNVTFDIATTNTVHVVTMRYAIDDDFATASAYQPDVAATSTNGAQGGAPLGRMVTTANEFGTTSATFTVPAGFNTARLQIYNFGASNSLELDNFKVELAPTASVEDLKKFNFKSYPNPAQDRITLSAIKSIDKIEIYNLLGQQVINKNINLNNTEINVSNLSKGVYLVKAFIGVATGTYKVIKE